MSVTLTNHLVIWKQTYLEGISQESLKTDFMSRRNVFQFWYIILYLRLTNTILCLVYIHYNILEQFETLGDGITFISWIWDHKWEMSRRNVFKIMPFFMFRPILGILENINKWKAIRIYLRGGFGVKTIVGRFPYLPHLIWEMCSEQVPSVTESNIFSLCLRYSCYFKLKLFLAA